MVASGPRRAPWAWLLALLGLAAATALVWVRTVEGERPRARAEGVAPAGGEPAARAEERRPAAPDAVRPDAGAAASAASERTPLAPLPPPPRGGAAETRAPFEWTGRVLDAETLVPVEQAGVVLSHGEREAAAATGADGRFTLPWLEGLPADLLARAPGHLATRVPDVRLEAPGDVRLLRAARIEGTVVCEPPWRRERVRLWHTRTSSERFWTEREVSVGSDGAFAFEELEPGTYAVAALATAGAGEPRVVAWELGIDLAPGESRTVALDGVEGAEVEGIVRGTGGGGFAGTVRARPATPGLPDVLAELGEVAARFEDGRPFRLADVPPGAYRVEVLRHGEVGASRLVALEPGERRSLVLQVPGTRALSGVVLDAAGGAASGVSVLAVPPAPSDRAWDTETDAGGRFLLGDVPREVDVLVVAYEGPSFLDGLVVPPGEGADDLVLVARAPRVLRGAVRSSAGGALAGVRVELDQGPLALAVESGADGVFALEGLLPLPARLRASADGWIPLERALGQDEAELEIVLEPAVLLRGRAVTERGEAVAGQPLVARSGEERAVGRSDAYGRFALELAPGEWEVTSSSYAWRLLGPDPRVVALPGAEELELVLAPRSRPERASLVAVVESAAGGPVERLRVQGFVGGTYAVDGGELRATGLTPTRHSLRFVAAGHVPLRVARIDLRPGQEVDLGLVLLEPATELTVLLRDGAGGPVPGAEVRLEAASGERSTRVPHRGAGRYATPHAPRGSWTLRVERPGRAVVERALEVRAQERQTVEVVVPE